MGKPLILSALSAFFSTTQLYCVVLRKFKNEFGSAQNGVCKNRLRARNNLF